MSHEWTSDEAREPKEENDNELEKSESLVPKEPPSVNVWHSEASRVSRLVLLMVRARRSCTSIRAMLTASLSEFLASRSTGKVFLGRARS